ncbi:MAG: hypothetical protein KDC87_14985 [Planctomycetes bacterium]|nr:hypothetical protein [Planctomycetota bacterium]MCB9889535.1 hypothetical protein [Planctomycetota bacterium]
MTRFTLPSVVAALLGAASLSAQISHDGPYWNGYPLPANLQTVTSIGTQVVLQTTSAVHFYSGLLRTWTVLPVSSTAVVRVANRYSLVEDGLSVHAYSTATGEVQTLTVSGSAKIYQSSLSSTWTACVEDGGTLHGYSAFLGAWVPLKVLGSVKTIDTNSQSVAVVDDVNVYGFSALYGTWVATPTRTGGTYATLRNGVMALYSSPDEVKVFSSFQNTWSTAALPGAQTAVQHLGDGMLVLASGKELALISTMTGNIQRKTCTNVPTVQIGKSVAVLDDGGTLTGFAPGTDAQVALPSTGPNGSILVANGSFGSIAVIDDGTRPTAFSGLTGRTSAAPAGKYTYTLGDIAALADGQPAQSYAYSALTGTWVAVPAKTFSNPAANYEALVLATTSGFSAYSARTGTWADLTTGDPLIWRADGAMAAVAGNQGIDVFDPLLGRWMHQSTAVSPDFKIHRLVGVSWDGSRAHGYSLLHHAWESVAPLGTFSSTRASSSIGYCQTSTHIYPFTANGSLSNNSRFPEFSRFLVRGSTMLHLQAGPPRTAVIGMFGSRPAEIPLGGWGTLRVDPGSAVVLPLGTIPLSGVLKTEIVLPKDPLLNGFAVHMQNLLIPNFSQPWLSNVSAPYIW